MKFDHYKMLKEHALAMCVEDGAALPPTKQIHPIVLAYVGDIVFSMYTRLRLVPTSNKVQVLHDIDAKMVSAVMQAKAMVMLEQELDEEELQVYHRGRNAKSTVPKSASVAQYRMATGFEALLGFLFLENHEERLEYVLDKSFGIIAQELQEAFVKTK